MGTVRDLVTSALRKIGVIASGEALKAEEANDALEAFRLMIDAWAVESLMIPNVSTVTKNLIVGEVLYTLGIYPAPVPIPLPDNHIETAVPRQIMAAFIRDGAGTDYSMIQVNTQQYSDISLKNVGARPSRFYFEANWPLNKLYLESQPYTDDVLYMKMRQNLNDLLPLLSLDDVLSLPYGYEACIMWNLAVEVASEYGQEIPQSVAVNATMLKRKIKAMNAQTLVSTVDRALSQQIGRAGTYDIYQGP